MSEPQQKIDLDVHPPAQKVGGMRVKQSNHVSMHSDTQTGHHDEEHQEMMRIEKEHEKAFRQQQATEAYGTTPSLKFNSKGDSGTRPSGFNPAYQPRSMNH
ncbi:hypothetical protein BX666DRAFT_129572 [Dichotomocladium elegans]|nr:hypothetical protein BX666DRAFT_129572 [Dichotomocladium elegans]